MWQELRRQPRWFLWVMLVGTGCTFASMLMRGPNHAFGGLVLYFAVLSGSGAMLVSSVVLMLLHMARSRQPRAEERSSRGVVKVISPPIICPGRSGTEYELASISATPGS